MAADQTRVIVTGIRPAIQDFLAAEPGDLRANMRAMRVKLEAMDKRFDRPEHQLKTYQDRQTLKGTGPAAALSLEPSE